MDNDRAGESLARLKGVKSVIRTAKADPIKPEDTTKDVPDTKDVKKVEEVQ